MTALGLAGLLLFANIEYVHGADEQISDSGIKNAIEYQLLMDAIVPANRMDIGVEKGVVTLTGEVANLLAEERSVEIAKSIKGVRAVVGKGRDAQGGKIRP